MTRMGINVLRRPRSAFARLCLGGFVCCGALALIGCGPKQEPQQPSLPTGAEFTASAGDVIQRAREFELVASQIQTVDISRQRPVVREAFAILADALPKLAGPHPSGVFEHQFSVVRQVRESMLHAAPADDVGPLDPGVVNSGMGATYNALRDLGTTQFYQDEALTGLLDELAKRVAAMNVAVAHEYPFAVRDAIVATNGVLTKMAKTMSDRVTEMPTGPSSGPTTAPATPAGPTTPPPATAPATPTPPEAPTTPPPATPPTTPPPATPEAPKPPETSPAPPATPDAPKPPETPAAPPATPPATPTTPDAAPAAPSPTTPPQATPPAVPPAPPPAVPEPPPAGPGTPTPPDPSKPPETPAPTPSPPPGEGNK